MLQEKKDCQPFVSVIIPVFNDNERLKICLEALENQTYPKHLYEVIVVDNASTEDVKIVVSLFEQACMVYEDRPGSYAARNKGVSVAKGEILAFTDSDCIPASNWIEKGVENLLNTPNCGLVAGKIDFFFRNPEQPTPVELYESINLSFEQEVNIREKHFGVTANLFTFKSVIDKIGPFNSDLKSGGDKQWGEKVFASGYKQVYADDVSIKHPARYSFTQLYTRVARFTGGKHDIFMSNKPSWLELFTDFALAFKPPFRSFYKIWKNPKLKGIKPKIQFTLVMLFIRYVVIVEKLRLYLGGTSRRE
jgi:glycosyltransferase involved in cell wall biosynthesis